MNLSIVFEQLLQVIFPKRSTAQLVETIVALEPKPRTVETAAGVVTYLFDYRDQAARALITEAKFHHHDTAIRLLGSAVRSYLADPGEHLILPIPLSPQRQRARGYNQTTAILNAARLHHRTDGLRRTNGRPQTNLSRGEAVTSQDGVFSVSQTHQHLLTGSSLILFDDVVTTGATLSAAKAALLPHSPAAIHCVALAH